MILLSILLIVINFPCSPKRCTAVGNSLGPIVLIKTYGSNFYIQFCKYRTGSNVLATHITDSLYVCQVLPPCNQQKKVKQKFQVLGFNQIVQSIHTYTHLNCIESFLVYQLQHPIYADFSSWQGKITIFNFIMLHGLGLVSRHKIQVTMFLMKIMM